MDDVAEPAAEAVPAAEAPPATVSEALRRAREAGGLSLREVAEIVRIRSVNLEAIEDGRFDRLPGSAYAIGFIRTYAEYLGFDGEQMVRRFKAEVAHAAEKPKLSFPLPMRESRAPTGALLLLGVVLAAGIYGGWYWMRATDRSVEDLVPPLPERLAKLIGTDRPAETRPTQPIAPLIPTSPTGSLPISPTQVVGPTGLLDPTLPQVTAQSVNRATPNISASLPNEPVEEEAPPADIGVTSTTSIQAILPEIAAPTGSPTLIRPDAAAAQTQFGADPAKSRVQIKASKDSWLQVRDGQGQLLITRVLKPGETYFVPNEPGITMVTGNAGGVDLVVDGKDQPKLGAVGQVLKNVSLDPARLTSPRPAQPAAPAPN